MASLADIYVPNLEKCFTGDAVLISWGEVLSNLIRRKTQSRGLSLVSFLTCENAKRALEQDVPSFQRPTPESKASFDSRTAAINIVSSTKGQYNIDEIKEDALWLSKEVDLDEIECLRLAVLEWQNRSRLHLQNGFSEAELNSLRAVFGIDLNAEITQFDAVFQQSQQSRGDFYSQQNRRTRMVALYLSERTNLLAVSRELIEIALDTVACDRHQSDEAASTVTSGSKESLRDLAVALFGRHKSRTRDQRTQTYTLSCINTMESCLSDLTNGNVWSLDVSSQILLTQNWAVAKLRDLLVLMDLVLLYVTSQDCMLGAAEVSAWFRIMQKYDLFSSFEPTTKPQADLIDALRPRAAILSVAILDPSGSVNAILEGLRGEQAQSGRDDSTPYFLDTDGIVDIHSIIFEAALAAVPLAAPFVFSWGLILYAVREVAVAQRETRETHHVQRAIDQGGSSDPSTGRRSSGSSIISMQQSTYEDILDIVKTVSRGEDPVEYIIRSAIDGAGVFEVIYMLCTSLQQSSSWCSTYQNRGLQELISVALAPVGYTPEILSAQHALLYPRRECDRPTGLTGSVRDPRTSFVKDPFLMETIFDASASRFPYEAEPFLQLCHALASADIVDDAGIPLITRRLIAMESFTQAATHGFSHYHTIREDENANLVALEQSVKMLDSSEQNLIEHDSSFEADLLLVPANATGEVISESSPPVIKWFHSYSALSLIGIWLDMHRRGYLHTLLSPFDSADVVVPEAIGLIGCLMKATLSATIIDLTENQRTENAVAILEELSTGLEDGRSIVLVVFDILESELQAFKHRSGSQVNCRTVTACVEFLLALIEIAPGSIWSALTRSSLVNMHPKSDVLTSIVRSIEFPAGDFGLFEACANLYHTLIDAALVRPFGRTRTMSSNNATQSSLVDGYAPPSHVVDAVLSSLTESMLELFNALPGCSFRCLSQKSRITTSLVRSFEKILRYFYGADDSQDKSKRITGVMSSAAESVTQSFCSPETGGRSGSVLLQSFAACLGSPEILTGAVTPEFFNGQIESSLSLCYLLVRLETLSERTSVMFTSRIWNAFPVLLRLLVASTPAQPELLRLMRLLLQSSEAVDSYSLLGRLGAEASRDFVEILSDNINSLGADQTNLETWKLLTCLLDKNQQWFATVILTPDPDDGSEPASDRFMVKHSWKRLRGKPNLARALDALSDIDDNMPELVNAMLDFVVHAQQWTWTADQLHSHATFFSAVTKYVGKLPVDETDSTKQSNRNVTASLVVGLSAVYLHYAKATQDLSIIQKMIPILTWLTTNAIDVAGYNSSLHLNLRKNFSAKYPDVSLFNFKRTRLFEVDYGESYFYDLDLADRVFSRDKSWAFAGKGMRQSFRDEFVRANTNLSLVQSQISLLRSFNAFGVEHSSFFVQDREVQKMMTRIVQRCLQANTRSYPAEKIFDIIFQTRADFALALLQRLVEVRPKGSDPVGLLYAAWDCVRCRNGNYESAATNGDLTYYRSTLAILLLTLQFHVEQRSKPKADKDGSKAVLQPAHLDRLSSCVMEIAVSVVADGFRSITDVLHHQKHTGGRIDPDVTDNSAEYSDLSMILTIFQSIIRIPRLPQMLSQLSDVLISSDVINTCLLLYSWSHIWTSHEGDAEMIFADLSLQFLVSLSSLPMVAEELAVDGIFNRLLSARVTKILQSVPDGASHLDSRPHCLFFYRVWATGMLPLCLNLLYAVGRPMAREVSAFLNSFPQQLRRASNAFVSAEVMTISLASETATLAMVSLILSTYRSAGASAGVDSFEIASLQGYDEHRKALCEDVESMLKRKHPGLASRIQAMNEKEMGWRSPKEGNLLEQKIVAELRTAVAWLQENQLDEQSS